MTAVGDIFLIVEDDRNVDHLRAMRLDPERGDAITVGRIPYTDSPSTVYTGGCIFCLGGWKLDGIVYEYDTCSNIFRQSVSMTEPVRRPAVAASPHEILVSGGEEVQGKPVASCHVYLRGMNRWTTLPSLQQARCWHRMCWFSDNRVFAIGGDMGSTDLSSVEMLHHNWSESNVENLSSLNWRHVAPMQLARSWFGCSIVETRIVVTGGYGATSSVEIFRPPTWNSTEDLGQWTKLDDLSTAMNMSFLLPLVDGLILIDYEGKMQRGMSKISMAASDLYKWVWEPCRVLNSVYVCQGLVASSGTSQC